VKGAGEKAVIYVDGTRPSTGISPADQPPFLPPSLPFPQDHRSPISSHSVPIDSHALAQLWAVGSSYPTHNPRRVSFAAPLGNVHILRATSAEAGRICEPRLSCHTGQRCTLHDPQRATRSDRRLEATSPGQGHCGVLVGASRQTRKNSCRSRRGQRSWDSIRQLQRTAGISAAHSAPRCQVVKSLPRCDPSRRGQADRWKPGRSR
jgi:hypothetical protein